LELSLAAIGNDNAENKWALTSYHSNRWADGIAENLVEMIGNPRSRPDGPSGQ
jgi:hypothetical protein